VCASPALFAPTVVTDDKADQFEHDHDSDSDDDTLSGDPTRLEGEDEESTSNPAETP
jgi:hypothetical protein